MGATKIATAIAVAGVAALTLSGCIAQPSPTIAGSELTIAVNQPFTSGNPNTAFGSSETNASIAYATSSGFTYFTDKAELVRDESFGHFEKISDDPLAVTYTVADGVRWSDGTAVDAVDLLLEWAATSGALNTPEADPASTIDSETGAPLDRSDERILFDNSSVGDTGISLVTELPQMSRDRMSLTLVFDEPFADWESTFFSASSAAKPAHVVGAMAFASADAHAAKERVYSAIVDQDEVDLASIARTWNTVFNFHGMPANDQLMISNGPYVVSEYVATQYLTLRANEMYTGSRRPVVQEITVRFLSDPLAQAQALLVGSLQLAVPTMNADVRTALATMDVTILDGVTDSFDHLDFQFAESANGSFEESLVRQAFMKTVPREEIVAAALKDLQPRADVRSSFLFSPATPSYSQARMNNGSSEYSAVDIEGAKQLLAEAEAKKPAVCILFDAKNESRRVVFELIKSSAKEAGFVVSDCSAEDWQSVLGTPGAYDAALFSWRSPRPGVGLAAEIYGTDGYANLNYFSDSTVDSLLADASSVLIDSDESAELLREADAALWEAAYGLPLFQHPRTVAIDQDRVSNVSISPLPVGVWWNVWEWTP